jgi:hypothetical protein
MTVLKPVTVTFTIDENVAHEIVARIFASGETPTVKAVRDEARFVYEFEGTLAETDTESIVLSNYEAHHEDVSDEDSLNATIWLIGLGWIA